MRPNKRGRDKSRPYCHVEVRFGERIKGLEGSWVRRVVAETLRAENAECMAVSVLLTNNKEIRRLNREFLKHDYATDVISFGYVGAGLKPAPTEESNYLGDLVVSVEMARAVAKELGIPFKEELARYLVHGTLHLLGYEDGRKKDKMLMDCRQEEILSVILAKARI